MKWNNFRRISMRKYKNEKLIKVICNHCGQELSIKNGILIKGACTIKIDWDYFSNKDGERHQFDLCEACYDDFVKSFQVPLEIMEHTEWI